MDDLSNHDFKSLMEKIVKPEEYFIYLFVNGCLESEISISSTRIMRRILYTKYKKSDINKVMTE